MLLRGRRLIAFGPDTELNPLWSDAEFFSRIDWDPAAPKTLARMARSGDWQRTVDLLIARLAAGLDSNPRNGDEQKLSLWSLDHLKCPQRASRLMAAWQGFQLRQPTKLRLTPREMNGRGAKRKSAGGRADPACQALEAAADDWLPVALKNRPLCPLELLVLFEILRDASAVFPIELAARLWRGGLTILIERSKAGDPTSAEPEPIPDFRLKPREFAIEMELAWQAGLVFASVAGSRRIRDMGREGLWKLLANSSDSAGVPAAHSLGDLPIWMVSVVRSREWGRRLGQSLFDASQEKRLRGMISALAKFCRDDGRLALTSGETNSVARVWSTVAATVPGSLKTTLPGVRYLLSLSNPKKLNHSRLVRIPRNGSLRYGNLAPRASRPVFQSDDSRLACLRSDWSRSANSIWVAHQGRFPALEMAIGGRTLLTGDWEIDLRVDGRPVEFIDWTCACWHSDNDGDYLELQSRPTGLRVERQVFLSRTDDFALFADVVVADQNAKIERVSRLELSTDCVARLQTETRECRLSVADTVVRIFPLGLPCRRLDGAAGELRAGAGRLELSQSGIGGLYSPLVLDWCPGRRRSPATWRRLTVALDGAVVAHSWAAGFLMEVGPVKWLIYRGLRPTLEPRSVLGQHTMYETLVGRFVRGDLDPMVQVEQETETGP